MEIILYHIRTKTVNGGDLCVVKQGALFLQMFIVLILCKLFLNCQTDPLPHLPCCRPRKCHDQQSVNIHRMHRVGDHGYNTLHQHCRLAAPCCCTDQYVASPGINDPLLLCCPHHSHTYTSLSTGSPDFSPSFILFHISSGFRGFSRR